uniref:Acid phosphatase n=1 Tax=uncultured organism TaxID=155900 RepID=E9KPK6_9ZZZZ|nr:acid phosphatase [uncultured organism]
MVSSVLANVFLLSLLPLGSLAVAAEKASSFAGSTTSFVFPPNGTAVPTTYFPDATQVGNGGPTPTGDEAAAIETAPALAKVDTIYPLVSPVAAGEKSASTFDVAKYWGNLSPMYSVDSVLGDTSPLIPEGCSLNQVHLLHRHGARYPTTGGGPAPFAALLHNTTLAGGVSASGALEFLNTWTYKLGAEILTPFGREQLFNLGVGFRVQYGDLLKGFTELPVWRTTSEDRMVDSALHFAAGFFGVRTYQSDYNQVIIIEASGFNNTLAPYESASCPNANNAVSAIGSTAAANWSAIYLKDAVKRLQPSIKGLNLTTDILYQMQLMCPYETVALGYSKFCGLFTEEEWKGFEYSIDLEFWYGSGPGQPTASAQGIGYVQELVARLTKTPLSTFDNTVNSTLDGNNITFPVDQPIYVDATHDTVISTIVVAMNLTSMASEGPLPLDKIPEKQSYIVSQISPFGSRLVGQVLSCPTSDVSTHIRWVLNDAVLPLTGIEGCKENKDGLCELDVFIKGLQKRIEEVDFVHDCTANYTVPVPDNIVDGQYPTSLRNKTTST